MLETAVQILRTAWNLLNETSVWLVVSFVLAGIMRNLVSPDRMQRMLGNRRLSSVLKATFSGMLLPICSCGVIPLGLGLYYSGAYLGPVLAFMTATPILNPAALLLTYGFLGPQILLWYLISGVLISVITGLAGNYLAGKEIHAPGFGEETQRECLEEPEAATLLAKLRAGLEWGFKDMGAMVSKYVCYGLILVGVVLTLVPQEAIQQYLGAPGLISVLGIAALGAVMYVCAVGHIPFIAVLVASGAAPGLAITFLISGAATNIPELLSIGKLIGRRAAVMYLVFLTGLSILAGYVANQILLPDFVPFFNLDKTRDVVMVANQLLLSAPKPVQYFCSGIIILLAGCSLQPQIRRWIRGGS